MIGFESVSAMNSPVVVGDVVGLTGLTPVFVVVGATPVDCVPPPPVDVDTGATPVCVGVGFTVVFAGSSKPSLVPPPALQPAKTQAPTRLPNKPTRPAERGRAWSESAGSERVERAEGQAKRSVNMCVIHYT